MVRVVRTPFLIPTKALAQVLLPKLILVRRGVPLTVDLLAHELGHVNQIARLGLLRYWVTYLWLLFRHGYWRHPMELEADAYATTPDAQEQAARLVQNGP